MAKKRIDPKLPIAPVGNESIFSRIAKGLGNIAVDGLWSWLMRADSFGDRLVRRLNELFREQDDGTIAIFDEETYIGQATGLNFTGAGVTAAQAANLPVGNYDITIPGGGGGGGGDTIEAEADEDIAAGQFVAVFNDSGTPKCRVAKQSGGQGYQADGWCEDAFASGATATIFLPGTVNAAGGTGLTAGDVFLGDDGYATNTAPTTAGYISQQIGVAEDGTSVAFEPQPDVLLGTAQSATGSGLQSEVFNSSGTFTPESGVTAVWVDIYAGGGSGGGGVAAGAGCGGGSGEYCQGLLVPISGAVTVTVGAGGVATAAGTQTGNAGSDSSFGTLTAKGGLGAASGSAGGAGGGPRGGAAGSGNNVGSVGASETPSFYGGSGGGGHGNASYGGGSGGRLVGGAPGTATVNSGGGGGATPIGDGAAGGDANTAGSDASANTGAGGGGGGNGSNTVGGAGGSGKVIVYWVS